MSPATAAHGPKQDKTTTLRLLVENARQLEEGSGGVVDGEGKVVTE